MSEASFNALARDRATTERATKSWGRIFWPEWISIILSIQAGKKWLTYVVLERREILLPFLLVNCHYVTGRIFELWISHQPEKNNNKGLFSKSKKSIVSVTFSVKARLIRTLWHGVASVTHSGFVQIFGSKIQDFFQTFFQTQGYQMADRENRDLKKSMNKAFFTMSC